MQQDTQYQSKFFGRPIPPIPHSQFPVPPPNEFAFSQLVCVCVCVRARLSVRSSPLVEEEISFRRSNVMGT